MQRVALVICAFLSTPCIAADIKSDTLLGTIYAEAAQYENTVAQANVRWINVSDKERTDNVMHFDPVKGWQYIGRNGKPPEQKHFKEFAKWMKGIYPGSYSFVADFLRNNRWTATSKNETTAVYTLAVDSGSKVIIEDMNMAKHLKTQITIQLGEKPFLKTLTMDSFGPFSPRTGATVKYLNSNYIYNRRADGEVVPVTDNVKAEFKVLLFSSKSEDTQIYTDVGKRVPKPTQAR
jgi:hypothetical protein